MSNDPAEQPNAAIIEVLRPIIEEFNGVSTEVERLYGIVMGLVVPRSSDAEPAENDNFSFAPNWGNFLLEKSESLVAFAARLSDLTSTRTGIIALGRAARDPSLPTPQRPLPRHVATDSTRVQYPQFSRLLDFFGRLRTVQEIIIHMITSASLTEEQLGSTNPRGASPTAIAALLKVPVDDAMLGDNGSCTICQETLSLGDEVNVLPCKHVFHVVCISTWLKLSDSCCCCRRSITA